MRRKTALQIPLILLLLTSWLTNTNKGLAQLQEIPFPQKKVIEDSTCLCFTEYQAKTMLTQLELSDYCWEVNKELILDNSKLESERQKMELLYQHQTNEVKKYKKKAKKRLWAMIGSGALIFLILLLVILI